MFDLVNLTESRPDTGEDDVYVGIGEIEGLLVGGLATSDFTCASVEGDPNVEPNERAKATIGFRTTVDPVGASIAFEPKGGDPIVLTDG